MRDSPSACVVDANILIDLHVGGLLLEISCGSTYSAMARKDGARGGQCRPGRRFTNFCVLHARLLDRAPHE
jgi:hypothetical protein